MKTPGSNPLNFAQNHPRTLHTVPPTHAELEYRFQALEKVIAELKLRLDTEPLTTLHSSPTTNNETS